MFRSIALRAAGIALAVSLAVNAGLWHAYRGALVDSERVRVEVVAAANTRLTESLSRAHKEAEAREAELQRRLELSNLVTQNAYQRAEEAEAALTEYQRSQRARASQDASYAAWIDAPLPSGVADNLRKLQNEN